MTICIALHFRDYVILAADTRTSFGDPPISIRDDTVKIVETGIGLITGAGFQELLDAVKDQVKTSQIEDTELILEIIKSHQTVIRRKYANVISSSDVDHWIGITKWIFSYPTTIDNQDYLRVGFIDGHNTDAHYLLASQDLSQYPRSLIIPPHEASKEKSEHLSNFLSERIKPISSFSTLEEHKQYHLELCAGLILFAGSEYCSVGHKMTYGIHTIAGQIEVSEIIDLDAE